jgi:hypothetical protein
MSFDDQDTQPIFIQRRASVPRMLAAVAASGAVALIGGYALGHAGGQDAGPARKEGAREGHARGARVGRREGYRKGFAAGKKAGYDDNYDKTFLETYRRGVGLPSQSAQQQGAGQQ